MLVKIAIFRNFELTSSSRNTMFIIHLCNLIYHFARYLQQNKSIQQIYYPFISHFLRTFIELTQK